MATYSTIKGFTIQSLATDPYATAVEAGTWASGGVRQNPLYDGTGCGTQTAALAALGTGGSGPTPGNQVKTEEYNGTAWTEVTDAPTAVRVTAGAGVQTSAVFASGYGVSLATESYVYDGTNWTEGGDIATGREGASGAGSASTAALIVGGSGPPGRYALTEVYNGSTWTEVADLNVAKENAAGIGTSTAALVVAGNPSPTATVEEWNGTSWTEVGDINTARQNPAQNGAGTTTLALIAGGTPPVTVNTEAYNGTSWTEVANMATARSSSYGGGTQTAAISSGGSPPAGNVTATEEFSVSATTAVAQEGQVWYNTTSTVLKGFGMQGTGAWASAPAMNTARGAPGSGGNSVSAMLCNGGDPSPGILTEIYNGSTWTETADSSTPRTEWGTSWCGTSTATLMATGSSGGPIITNVEEFNGTSWAAETAAPTAGRGSSGAGTTTAFVMAGGYAPGTSTASFEYDGSTWTTTGAINTGRAWPGGGGSQTAALMIGGAPVAPAGNKTETYDGSTWTEVAATNTKRDGPGLSGGQVAQTTAITFGGATGSPGGGTVTVNAEQWNGTSWTEVGNLATARRILGSGGPNGTAALAFGGGQPAPSTALTEEFSTPNATKTFTAT